MHKSLFIGLFDSTAAAVNIGLGFIPRKVTISRADRPDIRIEWSDNLAAVAATAEGVLLEEKEVTTGVNAVAKTLLVTGAGIRPYLGGDKIASASASYIAPLSSWEALSRVDMLGAARKWTLGNSSNRTGSTDVALDSTYVGQGSRIQIGGVWYTVQALTVPTTTANNVTLNRPAPTGPITAVTYKRDLAQAPAGAVMPAGITLSETAVLNVASKLLVIEAVG